jgi:hypothetical protein
MISCAALLLGVLSFSLHTLPADLRTFLQNRIDFSQQEVQAAEQGEVLTKLLDTDRKPEVAAFGIMHLEVPVEYFVQQYRDIEGFMRSRGVTEIGVFGNPALLQDLQGFTLEPSDAQAIRECDVGDCNVKLPASVIKRLRQDIDSSGPDFQKRVEAQVKQMLVDYVMAYRIGGNDSMGRYDDQEYPLRMADEFHALLQESDYLYEVVPELHEYLEAYPRVVLQDVEDVIYWKQTRYDKLRPIVSLTHGTIFGRSHGRIKTLIASKQLYASHYFEASLELLALVEEAESAESPGFFLLYLNRSRFDTLRKSGFVGMKHTVRTEILKKLDQEMNSTKTTIEARYREGNSPAGEKK